MIRMLLVLLSLALPLSAVLAEHNVNPDINRSYQNPDVEQWRGVFERDGREIWDRRLDILEHLNPRPGQSVADVGTGTGFFALMMAHKVGPRGRVYAVDIARNFVDACVRRAREQGLDNVVGVVNDQHSVKLPVASVDLVFIADTYHHFEYPQSTLDSIREALRAGGELVIVDFKREPGRSSPWVVDHVRAGEGHVVAEIESAGFALIDSPDFMRGQYFLRFRKR